MELERGLYEQEAGMGWVTFQDQNQKSWMANFDMIYALNRAAVQAQQFRIRSTITPNYQSSVPTFQVTTDLSGIHGVIETNSNSTFAQLASDIFNDGTYVFNGLVNMRASYKADTQAVVDMQKQAQAQSAANIDQYVAYGTFALTLAQLVAAADAFVATTVVTVLTGGSADVALAPIFAAEGIGINSAATWAGGGNAGEIAISATGSLVACAFPASSDTLVLAVGASLSGMFNGLQSLTHGDSPGTALLTAVGTGALGYAFGKYGPSIVGVPFVEQTNVNASSVAAAGSAAQSVVNPLIGVVTTPSTSGARTSAASVQGPDFADWDYVNTYLLTNSVQSSQN
jgi:hypothetical protein